MLADAGVETVNVFVAVADPQLPPDVVNVKVTVPV